MNRHFIFLVLSCLCCFALSAVAQEKKTKDASRAYPPNFSDAKAETYKTIGDVKLDLHIFNPPGHKPSDKRPAVVLFFGGGWTNGSPKQFEEQCRHLAAKGLVAIAPDYRVASRQQVKAVNCVADAKSAIRYVRKEASRLGIDPNRIAAGGGSAGGHVAAAAGLIKGFDESTEDASISSVPNALILFNPAVLLAPVPGVPEAITDRSISLTERMGVEPQALSPYHHVQAGAPPTIIFHGKADPTVPYKSVELFTKAMQDAGNQCTLHGYDDQKHGFFNKNRSEEYYTKTVAAMDSFLQNLGWLPK